jgi:hypothetical protein
MYVYFEKETRNILSITNALNENLENFVVKDKEEVKDFISGAKNFAHYVIDKDFNITEINTNTTSFNINEVLHHIVSQEDPDLTVIHDSKWAFSMQKPVSGNLFFAVTEKYNPNKLIRTMVIPASSLDCEIEFKYTSEHNINNISIWILHKTFPVCSLEVK